MKDLEIALYANLPKGYLAHGFLKVKKKIMNKDKFQNINKDEFAPHLINVELVENLISDQFPEYAHLPVSSVEKQGHDNRTFRLGNDMLVRIPSAQYYALKVPKEQKLLPLIKPYLSVNIPEPIKLGNPSYYYPFNFSIYKWLEGTSANLIAFDDKSLETIAVQLAKFLNELHGIQGVNGPSPGKHNGWGGEHVSVYDQGARKQIAELSGIVDQNKAIELWEQACKTKPNKKPMWIHGDFAFGNFLIKDGALSAVIDFGGMAIGDPASDLVIAWTFLKDRSREIFIESMDYDSDTWLRARGWVLWKATFELCQTKDKNNPYAVKQKQIIKDVLDG